MKKLNIRVELTDEYGRTTARYKKGFFGSWKPLLVAKTLNGALLKLSSQLRKTEGIDVNFNTKKKK